MHDDKRQIEMEIEVPGTPEQVWAAIATGPGISAWYVPHEVEEREGGAAVASFGEAPEMQVPGRVAAWEPPRRIVFDGGDPEEGLVFEWLVEAREGGTCVVRLVNSGFDRGGEWDDQFDAMREGWAIFLSNLLLHLTHHAGQPAVTSLPMAYTTGPADEAWAKLAAALSMPTSAAEGDRIDVCVDDNVLLSGTVARIVTPDGRPQLNRYLLLVDAPVPGTAFIGVESHGAASGVSAWTYLYGPDAQAATEAIVPTLTEVVAAIAD